MTFLENAAAHAVGREIVTFCAPCGDAAPGIPTTATGAAFDPTQTYVRVAADRFANLAVLHGCPVDAGVAPSLAVEPATDDGVLITPSTVVVTLEAQTVLTPATAGTVPTTTTTNHYHTTVRTSLDGSGLAVGAGFGLGVVATLAILALRRRTAMEPRATRL